jgi:uncharacterized protein
MAEQRGASSSAPLHVPRSTILKLASRCNIACSYCYWFRDESVYRQPKLLTAEAEAQFLGRLAAHIERHRLTRFQVLFHGGEPLLFGQARFAALCDRLGRLADLSRCEIPLAITTNAMLIDDEWADLLQRYNLGVTVSIDGPGAVHDARRVDFQNRGTFSRVMEGLNRLSSRDISPGILAVCDPMADPKSLLDFFYNELQVTGFDVLPPDHTHDDREVTPLLPFYRALFDEWYLHHAPAGRSMRFFDNIIAALLGGRSRIETIGLGEVTSMTVMPDGALEPLDVAFVTGVRGGAAALNIFDHDLDAISESPAWREIRRASWELHPSCRSCRFERPCGGGHIVTRWSASRRFNNPSVYCSDWYGLLTHIQTRILADLYVEGAPQPDEASLVDHV